MIKLLARELRPADAIEFTAQDGVGTYFEETLAVTVDGPTTRVMLQTSRGPRREVSYPSELRLDVVR